MGYLQTLVVNHHLPKSRLPQLGVSSTILPQPHLRMGRFRSMPAGDLSLRPTRKDAAARGGQVPRENPHDPSPWPSGYSLND